MGTINSSDIIFATVKQRGITLASIKLSGITSFAEILRHLRRSLSGIMGMTTIDLRNGSQGWQQRRTVMLTCA